MKTNRGGRQPGAELPVEVVLEDQPDELDPVPHSLNDNRQEEDVPHVRRKVGPTGLRAQHSDGGIGPRRSAVAASFTPLQVLMRGAMGVSAGYPENRRDPGRLCT